MTKYQEVCAAGCWFLMPFLEGNPIVFDFLLFVNCVELSVLWDSWVLVMVFCWCWLAVWVVCKPTLVVLSSSISQWFASTQPPVFTAPCQWSPHQFHCLLCFLPVPTPPLSLSSASGHPTTFIVYLPVTTPPLPQSVASDVAHIKTKQIKHSQTRKKHNKKTKSDITHNETHSHNSCVLGYWVEQQICWRSDFSCSFLEFFFKL